VPFESPPRPPIFLRHSDSMRVTARTDLSEPCGLLPDLAARSRKQLFAARGSCDAAAVAKRTSSHDRRHRERLIQSIGRDVARFQETSFTFDDVAAEILALDRDDLPAMTLLLFAGPASVERIAAVLGKPRARVATSVERLQLAGYARPQPGGGDAVELTGHAQAWIHKLWAPMQEVGEQMLRGYPTSVLETIGMFLARACQQSERQTTIARRWLGQPAAARRAHLRGGLSPAALRRVQVFIEANLGGEIRLADLAARAGLSAYHFARAFKVSAGQTPRAFVESRRIAFASRLIADTTQPLAAVAVDAGFGTQSRLTTVFRRQTGFTPAEYRRGRRQR
jgi:AraC family transcriptional regulator